MVFKPGSLIETIFNVADDSHIRYGEVIHQIAAYGVCNALDLIYKFDSSCDWLVLLGDNYFGGHANLFPQSGKQALVGVVSVENIDENLLPHLDGYNRQQGEWLRRGSDIDYAIAGGYLLRPEHMQEAQHHNDLITYFNVINASMHELNTFGDWLDLGTPESYKQYWTGS
jgi:dTDP-glucose pyrophosphorylase